MGNKNKKGHVSVLGPTLPSCMRNQKPKVPGLASANPARELDEEPTSLAPNCTLFPQVHHICPFGHILQFDNFILIKVIFSNRRKTADSFRWPFPWEVTWSQPQVRRDCVICVYSALYSGKGSLTRHPPQGSPASPWAAGLMWASEREVSFPTSCCRAPLGLLTGGVHSQVTIGFAFLSEPRYELRGPGCFAFC